MTKFRSALLIFGLMGVLLAGSTLALYNDEVASLDNMFTSGGLDLQAGWDESRDGQDVETQQLTDDPGPIFEVTDLQPGESGEATVGLHVYENPAWLGMRMEQTANLENGRTGEGERPEDNTENEGELGRYLNLAIWYDDGDNERENGEQLIFNGTAHELGDTDLASGVFLDGTPGTTEQEPVPNSTTQYLGISYHLDEDADAICDSQTDVKLFDIAFYIEQARHNDNPDFDSEMLFSDAEISNDNRFEAGEWICNDSTSQEENETIGVPCPPLEAPADGSQYTTERVQGSNQYDVTYDVEWGSENTWWGSEHAIKFEDATSNGEEDLLGEKATVETDTFQVTVENRSNATISVTMNAGQKEDTVSLAEEGDTAELSDGIFTVVLDSVDANADGTFTYTFTLTSDDAGTGSSPALSNIVFEFCPEDAPETDVPVLELGGEDDAEDDATDSTDSDDSMSSTEKTNDTKNDSASSGHNETGSSNRTAKKLSETNTTDIPVDEDNATVNRTFNVTDGNVKPDMNVSEANVTNVTDDNITESNSSLAGAGNETEDDMNITEYLNSTNASLEGSNTTNQTFAIMTDGDGDDTVPNMTNDGSGNTTTGANSTAIDGFNHSMTDDSADTTGDGTPTPDDTSAGDDPPSGDEDEGTDGETDGEEDEERSGEDRGR
jgi:predicted ribosomally synthesized peptide with SipW-like signal peptide